MVRGEGQHAVDVPDDMPVPLRVEPQMRILASTNSISAPRVGVWPCGLFWSDLPVPRRVGAASRRRGVRAQAPAKRRPLAFLHRTRGGRQVGDIKVVADDEEGTVWVVRRGPVAQKRRP